MTDYTSNDDEERLLNDPEYAEAWVEQEIARSRDYFFKEVFGEEEKGDE